jgi:hypothetical protein
MKKKLVLLFSMIAILAISACSASGTSTGNATQTVTTGSNQLPALSKLVVGTYKLIDSSTPITQAQAKELVILWKAYKELQTRDTKAQQEVTDLLTQINSTLTTDQITAIDTMNLSTRDVMSLVQELGVAASTTTTRTGSSSSSSSSSSSRSSGGASGGFPGGGFPGGGVPPADGGFVFNQGGGGGQFGGGTSATPSASMRATIQARRAASGAQTATMALLLIDPLITKLQSIANQG